MPTRIEPGDQTPEERRVVASLERLAKRWPKDGTHRRMGIYAAGQTLNVVRDVFVDPSEMEILAEIYEIPATGGDW